MIVLDPQYHVHRAKLLAVQGSAGIKDIQNTDAPTMPFISLQTDEVRRDTRWSRLQQASFTLFRGISIGGISGFSIGALYALRIRHQRPMALALGAALNLGMLGGLFSGFRELGPMTAVRFHDRIFPPQSDPTFDTWSIPEELPSYLRDLNDRDLSIIGSAISGFAAGSISAFSRGHARADAKSLSTGNVGSFAMRTGLFWGLALGTAHFFIMKYHDWRLNKKADATLRSLYKTENIQKLEHIMQSLDLSALSDNKRGSRISSNDIIDSSDAVDEQSSVLSNGTGVTIPPRASVVSLSWGEILSTPSATLRYFKVTDNILTLLPMVFSQKDFEYRQYLDSKVRLMEDEMETLEKSRRARKRRLQELQLSHAHTP